RQGLRSARIFSLPCREFRIPGTSSCHRLLPINQPEGSMADRTELVEAALDVYPEGLALLDSDERVVFWNRAAELITGYSGAEVIGRPLPDGLEPLAGGQHCKINGEPRNEPQPGRGSLVHALHKLGRD